MEKQDRNAYQMTEFLNVMQLFILGYYNLYVFDIVVCHRFSHYPILMMIAVCFSFWTREKVGKFGVYFLTRFIIVFYGVFIGRDEREKVLFALAGVVICMVSWYRRIHVNHKIYIENIGLLWLVLLLPGYLFMGIYGETDTTSVLLLASLLFIWLYYLNRYVTNREKYFINNKKTAEIMQDKDIKTNSNKGICFFLICSLVTLFWQSGLYVKELEEKIRNAIFRFFQWLLELLTNVKEEGEVLQEVAETPIPNMQENGYGETIEGPEWLRQFFEVLEQFLQNIMGVFWIICIILILFSIVYGIWHAFYHKDKFMENKNIHKENVKIQKIKKESRKKEGGKKFQFLRTPNQKIRQLFYKEIKEFQKEEVCKECMTASELTKVVYENRKMVVEYLLPYYHRARYSKTKMTREDVDECNKYRKCIKKL